MYVLTGPLRTTAAILTALQVRPILVVKWYGKAVNLPLCILFVDLPSILYKTNTGKCQTLKKGKLCSIALQTLYSALWDGSVLLCHIFLAE